MSSTTYVRSQDNPDKHIYVGIKNKPIDIKLDSDAVLDDISEITFYIFKPDGNQLTRTMTDGDISIYDLENKILRYMIQENDINIRGEYRVQVYINEDASTTQPYTTAKFMVYSKGEF